MEFFKRVVLLAMFWKASESTDCGWATDRHVDDGIGILRDWAIGTCDVPAAFNYLYSENVTSSMYYCNAEETKLMRRTWYNTSECDGTDYKDEDWFWLTAGAYDCNLDYSCATSLTYSTDNYTDDICSTYDVSSEDLADWKDWSYYNKVGYVLDTCMRTDHYSTVSYLNYSAVMYQCDSYGYDTITRIFYNDINCTNQKISYELSDCYISSTTGMANFQNAICPESESNSTTLECGWADGRHNTVQGTGSSVVGAFAVGVCEVPGFLNAIWSQNVTSSMYYCNAEETQLMRRMWYSNSECDDADYEDEVFFNLTVGAYDCNLDYSCATLLTYNTDNYTDDICSTYDVSSEDLEDWQDWSYYIQIGMVLDTCMRTDSNPALNPSYSAKMYQCNGSTITITYYIDVNCSNVDSSTQMSDCYVNPMGAFFRYVSCSGLTSPTTTVAPTTTDSTTTTTTVIPIPTTTTTTTTPVTTVDSTADATNHLVAKSSVLFAVVAMISVIVA